MTIPTHDSLHQPHTPREDTLMHASSIDRPRTRALTTVSRLTRGLLLALAGALLVTAGLAAPASADDAKGAGGWIRLSHLSPDTPSVNVALTSFSDSKSMIELKDVSYGDVSTYTKVPAGRYVASMTPAGGSKDSTPAITQAVTVEDGKAYTVAAVGKNADLTGKVLTDDLQPPKEGQAKIRLLQATTAVDSVTVTAMGGPVLARDAAFGTATGYAEVKSGAWSLELAPSGSTSAPVIAEAAVTSGSVNTVIVLDNPAGGVTAKVIKDASGVKTMPKKGIETGGGGTATDVIVTPAATNFSWGLAPTLGASALLLAALAVVVVVRARRTPAPRRALVTPVGSKNDTDVTG